MTTVPVTVTHAFVSAKSDGADATQIQPSNWNAAHTATVDEATASNMRAGSSSSVVATPAAIYNGLDFVSLTDAATIAVDMSTFINATVTLAGNRALGNPTNAKPGQSGMIEVIQDGTGTRTLSFGGNWKREGGAPTLSTAASAKDYIVYSVRSSSLIIYSFIKAPS